MDVTNGMDKKEKRKGGTFGKSSWKLKEEGWEKVD
jgi:hypothetical protein